LIHDRRLEPLKCGHGEECKKKNSWLDKVTNGEVLGRVNEDRQILNSIGKGNITIQFPCFDHDRLLHEIIEGRMRGKPTRGRREIQMLRDLANDDGFGCRHRDRM